MTPGFPQREPESQHSAGQQIVFEQATRDYALYLNGALVGYACNPEAAQSTLTQLAVEQAARPSPPPLPPAALIAAALEALAVRAPDPAIYQQARARLLAGLPILADGADRLIDGARVQGLPGAQPWRCDCGQTRCWHGALLDGIVAAWERLAAEDDSLPFIAAV